MQNGKTVPKNTPSKKRPNGKGIKGSKSDKKTISELVSQIAQMEYDLRTSRNKETEDSPFKAMLTQAYNELKVARAKLDKNELVLKYKQSKKLLREYKAHKQDTAAKEQEKRRVAQAHIDDVKAQIDLNRVVFSPPRPAKKAIYRLAAFTFFVLCIGFACFEQVGFAALNGFLVWFALGFHKALVRRYEWREDPYPAPTYDARTLYNKARAMECPDPLLYRVYREVYSRVYWRPFGLSWKEGRGYDFGWMGIPCDALSWKSTEILIVSAEAVTQVIGKQQVELSEDLKTALSAARETERVLGQINIPRTMIFAGQGVWNNTLEVAMTYWEVIRARSDRSGFPGLAL